MVPIELLAWIDQMKNDLGLCLKLVDAKLVVFERLKLGWALSKIKKS